MQPHKKPATPAKPRNHTNWLHIAAHIGALVPLALLGWDFFQGNLTINPIQDITFRTGKTALILLILSLACTPIHTVFSVRQIIPLRRTLGLYATGYVILHFLTFAGLDYGFRFDLIGQAILEKRYVMAGLGSLLLLLPLAVTSTKGWMRRLGKNWKRLHRLAYPAAILAVVHYAWVVKADLREPLIYGAVLGVLLLLRVPAVKKRVPKRTPPQRPQRRGA
jgi:sulfoxide reductase heme-binding subunit YedZ